MISSANNKKKKQSKKRKKASKRGDFMPFLLTKIEGEKVNGFWESEKEKIKWFMRRWERED